MIKRILLTIMTLLVLYSAVIVGYKLNEPDDIPIEGYLNQNAISYESLNDYTLSDQSSNIHYYFFESRDSNDCAYVENTVLKEAARETGLNLASLIEAVDITDLERNMDTSILQDEWGISSYPAFAACRVQDGKILVENTLQWNPESPISTADIIDWLTRNGLYEDPNALQSPAAQ